MTDLDKVCPECGVILKDRNLAGHALSHFPEYLDPAKSTPLARKRQKLILEGGVTKAQYEKEHGEEV